MASRKNAIPLSLISPASRQLQSSPGQVSTASRPATQRSRPIQSSMGTHRSSPASTTISSASQVQAASQLPTPSPDSGPAAPHLTTRQSLCGRIELRKVFSSARLSVFLAIIALGSGAYYFYGQYIISWKSWEVGIWKDCHDRSVSRHHFPPLCLGLNQLIGYCEYEHLPSICQHQLR